MKISSNGTKTGTMSLNQHISACPKAIEAGCDSFCYVKGTYTRHKQTIAADNLNLDILESLAGSPETLSEVIIASMKRAGVKNLRYFRIHERGDFISPNHFKAVMLACKAFPKTIFWAYTKSYHVLDMSIVPSNVKILVSFSVNDTPLYRKRALKVANELKLPMAFASAYKASFKAFLKEQNVIGFSCPEQLLTKIKPDFKCIDCRLCWDYKPADKVNVKNETDRFVVHFQGHGMYRGQFKDFVHK